MTDSQPTIPKKKRREYTPEQRAKRSAKQKLQRSRRRKEDAAFRAKETESARRWREENREKYNATSARWRSNRSAEQLAQRKSRSAAHHIRSSFGLEMEDIDWYLTVQEHACAICKTPLDAIATRSAARASRRFRPWHIDHDHTTGAIRGLLCAQCNHAIGSLRDDPESCVRAAEYLRMNASRLISRGAA